METHLCLKRIIFLYIQIAYFGQVLSGKFSLSNTCSFNEKDNGKITLSNLPKLRHSLELTKNYSNHTVFPNSTLVWRINYKNGNTDVLGQCVFQACSSKENVVVKNNYTSKVSLLLINSVTMAEDNSKIEFRVDDVNYGNETLTVYDYPRFKEANIRNRATSGHYKINNTHPLELDINVDCMKPLPKILVKFKEANSETFMQLYPHMTERLDCAECGKHQQKLKAHLIANRSIFTNKTLMHGTLSISLKYGCYEDFIASFNVTFADVEDEENTPCDIPEGIVCRILLFSFAAFLNLRCCLNPIACSSQGAGTTTTYIHGVIRYESDDGIFTSKVVISVTVFVSLLAYCTGLALLLLLPKLGVSGIHLEEHCAYSSLFQFLWSPGIVIGLITSICANTIHKLVLWIYAMNMRSPCGNQEDKSSDDDPNKTSGERLMLH